MNTRIALWRLATVLLTAAIPAAAQQSGKTPRIGYLGAASHSANAARIEAFRQGLRELGYLERQNVIIEWRHAEGKLDRLRELMAELLRLKVDIIVTGGTAVTRVAKKATSTIPIVMTNDADPVGTIVLTGVQRAIAQMVRVPA